MSRILFVLLVLVISRSSFALAMERSHAVVRDGGRSLPGREITFGLRADQRQALYELTNGAVDLRHLRAVPLDRLSSVSSGAAVEGWLYRNVPPPGFFGKADPDLANEWWLQKHNLPKAWESATGKGVTLADCDAGYYTAEKDLIPNLLLDHRFDLADKDDPFRIDDGNFTSHGTSVAAILVGALDGAGTNGMAFDAKLVPLQNYNYSSADDIDKEEATARCVLRALTIQSVKIIVLENQTATGSSETFVGTRNAVRLAQAAGVTVVGAAGNYYQELKAELADDTGSVIVGAVDPSGKKESWSNHGKRITVAAYGSQLKTLSGPNGAMGSFGGTSGATPQVAATVAMMLEVNPNLTPAKVREILETTRVTAPENASVGGMLNVVGAIEAAKSARAAGLVEAELLREEVVRILTN